MAGEDNWNTDNEKNYIDLLVSGAYRESPQLTVERRLKNYIRSAQRRIINNTFGNVNGGEVVQYAKQLLGE